MNPNASSFVPSWGPKPETEKPKEQKTLDLTGVTLDLTGGSKKEEPKKEEPKKEEPKKEEPKKEEPKKEEPKKEEPKKEEPKKEEPKEELKKENNEDENPEKQEEFSDDEEIQFSSEEIVEDNREHLNLVFIGHVDAGKSTICGQIMLLSNQVDDRTIEKFKKEASDRGRDSWFLAYIMDANEEERAKGKTVECGRAYFSTENKRYTILDAPGHKNYVPNMIGGAQQADVAVLVVSARRGEFETGFHKAGQTREHAMLVKTMGVKLLVIVVNKMDDETVNWDQERFDYIQKEMNPYLAKSLGYRSSDVFWVPISGISGANIKEPSTDKRFSWYKGKTLFDTLDGISTLDRFPNDALRLPVLDKYKSEGRLNILGKVEAGKVAVGDQLMVMPSKFPVEITEIFVTDTTKVRVAKTGENVRIVAKGLDEENINRGYVICPKTNLIPVRTRFEVELFILELLSTKSLFTAGYRCVMHLHTALEDVVVVLIVAELDKKTRAIAQKRPQFLKKNALCRCILETSRPVPLELADVCQPLARLTLRDEAKTIAMGKVISFGPAKKPESNKN